MRLFLTIPVLFALAACGQQPAPANDAAALNAAGNAMAGNDANATNYVAAIGNLNEPSQQGVFLRAIRDANLSCEDVDKVEKIDPVGGVPTWRAHCVNGSDHLIQVKADGSAVVISPTGQ